MVLGLRRAIRGDAKGTERRRAPEILLTTLLLKQQILAGIPADCVPQLKLTAGKASGKLFALLSLGKWQ